MAESSQSKLRSLVKLMRQLPPNNSKENIDYLSELVYDDDSLYGEFLQIADKPSEVVEDNNNHHFLGCEINREGESYRSPFDNKYYPNEEEGKNFPAENIRELEVALNKIFQVYKNLYYGEDAMSSAYVQLIGSNVREGFVVNVMIQNNVQEKKKIEEGSWDSSNLIKVTFHDTCEELQVEYELTTTILLHFSFDKKKTQFDEARLSGTQTRKIKRKASAKEYINYEFHVENIGSLIEENENTIRQDIEEIFLKKTKEILETTRFPPFPLNSAENSKKLKDAVLK